MLLRILIWRAVKLHEKPAFTQGFHMMQDLRHNNSNVVRGQFRVRSQRSYAISQFSFQNRYFCPYTSFGGVVFPQRGWNLGKYRCPFVWNKAIGHLELIAPNAVEHFSYHAVTAFLGNNPRAIDKGRIMPDMLRMAATKERYRVAFAVQVKSCNWSFHT
jgi:hypothetical protein